ncbi:methyl-accepting chemotaxis protein [Bordetella genomosp. 10]|uniref:Methyl-accepting chemotaxis protein n=1 Tax=Bordetella genomosp. 10 TaxID=1416804 RepID=A0A261SAY4_9BORD|nr:methyl-accepting chemotaxis protein [Bordetella genomosp. 10]OZI33940.1 methyl-accepting chemotaxis protein [Bordetella genomosp. 10]
MKIENLKIGIRLAISFGVILALSVVLVMLATSYLSRIGQLNGSIVNKEWPKADAGAKISALMRSNARRTLELLVFTDAAARDDALARIARNKQSIDNLIQTLEGLLYTADGKSFLAGFKTARTKYVESFTAVGELVKAGKMDEARRLAQSETMPRLDAAIAHIDKLVGLQGELFAQRGEETTQTIATALKQLLAVSGLVILLGAALAFWITRSITAPIREAVGVAVKVSQGDLTQRIEVKRRDEMGQLLGALRDMNESLRHIVDDVRQGSDMIATATSQIAAGNTDLSARTEEQAASLEQTAASMEELTATVRQNAESARQGNALAMDASGVATRSGEAIGRVVHTMREISDSSSRVADIIGTIEGIAFQTNILALNAAVEAARAGEQGKGFAVVATEVRTLAQRSASAAREIKELIDESVSRVQAGEAQVNEAGGTINDVVAAVRRVTDLMGEITAASAEQHQGIEQVGQAVAQMDQVTQQNAALVEQAAAAAQSLQEQASRLVAQVGVFRLAA